MKGAIVLATICAVLALAACRQEEHHESMKLGADVSVQQQAAR